MTEITTSRCAFALSALLLLAGCPDEASDEAAQGGVSPATTEVVEAPTTDLLSRLREVNDQLEARDFRAYLALRAEVSAGAHSADLESALKGGEPVAQRVAAVVLEDLLVSEAASSALATLARPALEGCLTDAQTPELTPLATRILGRLPRGSAQDFLLAAHSESDDPTTREMLLSAMGDNADQGGLTALKARYEGLSTCAEARHATLSVRRADDALSTPESRLWLRATAAPRVLSCADERAEAGEPPDADLHALIVAHAQSAATTLIAEVLLADVGRPLKLRALEMLKESGDPAAGVVLNESLKELASQGLAAEAARVINTLRGL
ncbi:MAG: hypothetical protein ACPGU1_20100 [Myxococcota bacterium]